MKNDISIFGLPDDEVVRVVSSRDQSKILCRVYTDWKPSVIPLVISCFVYLFWLGVSISHHLVFGILGQVTTVLLLFFVFRCNYTDYIVNQLRFKYIRDVHNLLHSGVDSYQVSDNTNEFDQSL